MILNTTDLLASILLIFLGNTLAIAYYTKIVLRYPTLTWDQVAILMTWVSIGLAQACFGTYSLLSILGFV